MVVFRVCRGTEGRIVARLIHSCRGESAITTRQEFENDYRLILEAEVQWRDMDAFRHVNNISYLIWFERVRIAFMDCFGGEEYDQSGDLVPVLASVECKYRFPLTYPDDILIGCGVRDIGEDRFVQTYGVYSLGHGLVAAEGHGRLVYFDRARGSKAPIPPRFKQRLLELAAE